MAAPPGPLSPPQPPPAAHPLLLSPTDADSFEVVEPVAKRLVPGVAAGDRWAGEDEEDDVKVPRPGSGASGGVPAAPPGAGRRRWAWGGAGGSRGHAARGPPSGWVGPRGAARPGRGGPALRVWPGIPPPLLLPGSGRCWRLLALGHRSPRVGVGEGCAVVAAGSGLPQRGPVPLPGPGRSWKALRAPRCWLLQEVARHMFA